MAVGADGAPFSKDDTVTAYLVSFINLLQRVQSCNDNHLLLGANICEEDHVLMKSYSSHLASEMREIEGKTLATPQGKQVIFRFELQYTQSQLKSATTIADLDPRSPLVSSLNCVRDTVKCGRLYKSLLRWFT